MASIMLDRFEGLFARGAQLISPLVEYIFRGCRPRLVAHLELFEVVDGDCGLRSPKRARQLRAERDGAQRRRGLGRELATRDSASRRRASFLACRTP